MFTRRELLRRAGLVGAASLVPCFTACKPGRAAEGGETSMGGSETGGSETGESGTGDSGTGETGIDDGLPTYAWEGAPGPETTFSHGVASGDPLADSIILWTRVSAEDATEIESFFELALDPEFEMRVAADWIPATNASRDFTVKIDVDALVPGTTYYYRFYALGRVSPIGRTRTAPSGAVEQLRFAVCTCASYAHGHFHAYAEIGARADLDAVLHLGDYIYEFGDGQYGDLRPLDPVTELITLDDYRRRYRLYRSDPGLQDAHRQHPFIVTWDDHEIANDGWIDGAANHDVDEGIWVERRAAGTQAYFEWLPLREGVPGRVYRDLPYGDLADLLVLDTRYEGRELQINLISDPDPLTAINDPDRQILGAEQETWLFDRLSSSTSTWIVLVQQIMLAQFTLQVGQDGAPNRPLFSDLWDGYDGARRRLYGHLREQGLGNVVVVTGDVHASFASELTEDPRVDYDPDTGAGSVAVEFVTPSVTSPGLGFDDATLTAMRSANPHWKFVDVVRHGYVTLDVRPERVQADWWLYSGGQITSSEFSASAAGPSWAVHAGGSGLEETGTPASEKPDPPALAP